MPSQLPRRCSACSPRRRRRQLSRLKLASAWPMTIRRINSGQRVVGRFCETPRRQKSARDSVTAANTGEHFPERIKNTAHRRAQVVDVAIVDIAAQQFALGGGMFAIGFNVDAEVFVIFWMGETVIFF